MLDLLYELKRDTVALVKEDGGFLVPVCGRCQVNLGLPDVHRGIPDPEIVPYAAAFLTDVGVGDEACVSQVLLAQPVCRDKVCAVVRVLVLQVTGAAVAFHFQRNVELRQNVLRCEDAEGIHALSFAGKQGTVVLPLRVRGFGIEEGDVVGRIRPGFHGGVIAGGELFVPLEVVVGLYGRSVEAQPRRAHVFPHERIFVEAVIGSGIVLEGFYLVVIAVSLPADESLVVHGIRQECRLKYSGGGLSYAVLYALDAVFALEDGVLLVKQRRELLLIIVALALCLGKACIPSGEFLLGNCC